MIFLLFLAAILSLALAAFCAGSETGFLSVQRGRVIHTAREGGVRAKVILTAISDMGRTTTALLVGNNLASVSFSSASAALSVACYPDSPFAQTVWSAVAAVVVLYFGEFAPKMLCAARPLHRLLFLSPIWKVFARVFVPIGAVVQAVIGRMLPKRETGMRVTADVVVKLLEDRKDGVRLSDFESALISRIMVLRAKGEFITPDSLLPAIDDDMV